MLVALEMPLGGNTSRQVNDYIMLMGADAYFIGLKPTY
jgi:hypothetical protein